MSKVISFQIPKSERTFIQYQEDRGKHFYSKLHQHPEAQITLIVEGRGQILVGDYVGRFEPGDVFLLGENIPHVFRSDSEYFLETSKLRIAGNTLFFDFGALGKALEEVEEMHELAKISELANGCFQLKGQMQEKVTALMSDFGRLAGLERLSKSIYLLSLLDFNSEELVPLNQIPVRRSMNERDGKRMDQVMRFILENSGRQISLEEVAEQAYMSKEAFCRFFKLRTRKTFTQYIQQLRITEAKKLLLETDLSIAQISYQVGFQTLSHFNKTFKSLTDMTPKDWRKLE
ncbi:AraC family transcriptional regulator [Algoriphagus halophytocola]|uniref:AraC family transcriptional regulator n=1 Tax=Algoriphagus halophytocola TaxID=2991499 RepID=A0ABY6ME19_9BACT|nr:MULTISPECIES: AraC family transcriptional regulator [unclassified Algoriphagus]UZD22025.1 AraC family transcriptional regulator [Algoriphagus sp. TR-M5]WBL43276.1 AraC family transcriptional regulator [Algoriphagus sp. TR-M9]